MLAAKMVVCATVGLACGSITGSIFSVTVGMAIEAADRSMAGLGSPQVLLVSMLYSAPGGAIAGVVASIWRRSLPRFIGTVCGGCLVALYPSLALWLHDDTSWPYSLLVLGGGPLVGTIAAGLLASWAAASFGAATKEEADCQVGE
jgi:hypothetical protein